MKTQGDTKRSRSVKAEFDPDFAATALGGAVLIEKTLRRLGLVRMIGEHLPGRSEQARYSMSEALYALVAALLMGARGIGAARSLREDALAREVFGLAEAPSDATMYRVLCELSGLSERRASETYETAGPRLAAMDLLGQERKVPARRRIVPDEPERALCDRLDALSAFLGASAKRCFKSLPTSCSRLHGWWTIFGDATDLEVEGNCFDAARMGREGRKIIRWLTVMLGPILVAQDLAEGNRDEGRAMPDLLDGAGHSVREMIGGAKAKVLALLDAAYFERQVIERLSTAKWDFIVCANQLRPVLTRIAQEQPTDIWVSSGPDAARGWTESQVGCFVHMPEGWCEPVTIVARRWREKGELSGCWHYSFVGTRIEPGDLPATLKKYDYRSAIWMLYGTKQGRENHYKTPLRDLGLHHPPSCRLGINQAFYAIAAAASNIAMVLRYAVVAREERGIELWRFRERYVRIAGYLVRSARRLTVRLSGVSVDALRQTLWRSAFAAAGRL